MKLVIGQTPRFNSYREGARWVADRLVSGDVLVLPEYWTGVLPLDVDQFREFITTMSEIAASLGGTLVAGAVAVKFGNFVKTVCPVVDKDGLLGYGEKIFPSAATGERKWVSKGEEIVIFKAAEWTIGCLVCVDLVYPELSRSLALAGAEVVVNPASVTQDRLGLWKSLGIARAFENSIYIASVLGTGYFYKDGRPAAGGSYIASPNGYVVEFGREAGLYVGSLSKEEILYARERRKYLDDVKIGHRFKIINLRR